MSRLKIFFLSLVFVSIAGFASADIYSVFFADNNSIFLLQIDDDGTIVTPLTNIGSSPSFPDGCASGTAVTQTANPDQLVIWANRSGTITRNIFSKSGMKIIGTTKIPLSSTGRHFIQSTQNSAPDFFMIPTGKGVAKGFGSDSVGSWDGRRWRISPGTDKSLFNAGVSPDGMMVWAAAHNSSFNFNHLYTQPLDSDGFPKGAMKGIANLDQIQSASISNPLHDGTRVIAYRMFRLGQFTPVSTDNLVMVQKIDSVSGSTVGPRRVITSTAFNCQQHSISIDQGANFVLFTKQDFSCSRDVLQYQAIDSSGRPTGPIKELVGCSDGVYVAGLNLMRESGR